MGNLFTARLERASCVQELIRRLGTGFKEANFSKAIELLSMLSYYIYIPKFTYMDQDWHFLY